MPDVFVADRGRGKTTAVIDSITEHGFHPARPGVLLTASTHETHLLRRLVDEHGWVWTRQTVISHESGARLIWHPATMPTDCLLGLDRRTPVWWDDADRTLYGVHDQRVARMDLVLVTATPGVAWPVLDRAFEEARRWEQEQARRWQVSDKRRGEDALMHLMALGHNVAGIDPATFGEALRLYGAA